MALSKFFCLIHHSLGIWLTCIGSFMRLDLLNYVFYMVGVSWFMILSVSLTINVALCCWDSKKLTLVMPSSSSHSVNTSDFKQFITCLNLVFTFYLLRIYKFIVWYDFGSAAEDAFIMRLTWCWCSLYWLPS